MTRKSWNVLPAGVLALAYLTPAPSPAWAAKATCPAQSVVLTGSLTTQMPPMGSFTYIETMALARQTHSSSMDGRWKVTKFKQDIIYPWVLRPPVNTAPTRTDLGGGAWMNCSATTVGNTIHNLCLDGDFTLDVWGGKIGYRRTGVTIGTVQGRNFKVQFGMPGSQQLNPVITGTVKDGAANTVSLQVKLTGGADEGRYAYDIGPSPTLTIKAEASTDPSSEAQKVHWTLPKIAGATRKLTPASAKGAQIEAVYTGMPARNSDFGKQTLSASLEVEGCPVEESQTFKVFFPRDSKNHPPPNPNWPNWLYYWKQTACGRPQGQTVGVIYAPNMSGCGAGTTGFYSYAEPKVVHKHVYICDLGQALGSKFEATVPLIGYDPSKQELEDRFVVSDVADFTGIDSFGYTMYHEFLHYMNYARWWEGYGQPYEGVLQPAYDKDQDGIPDLKEPAMGFDPTKRLTYAPNAAIRNLLLYDEHWIVYAGASAYEPGKCDAEDWAYPGKQWPQ